MLTVLTECVQLKILLEIHIKAYCSHLQLKSLSCIIHENKNLKMAR